MYIKEKNYPDALLIPSRQPAPPLAPPKGGGGVPANALTNKAGSLVLTNKTGDLILTRKAA